MLKLLKLVALLVTTTFTQTSCKDVAKKDLINVTYFHVNIPPYEDIGNEDWLFQCCGHTYENKTLNGIISRSIHYISRKHCPQFRFQPIKVDSLDHMMDLMWNDTRLYKQDINSDYFIFGPVPWNTKLYYKMQYFPDQISWLPGFGNSDGIVVVHRIADVDLSMRLKRAVSKTSILLWFLVFILPIVAIFLWIFDRSSQPDIYTNPLKVIFSKVYLTIVTLSTVGYGDIVPVSWPGKLLSCMWMMVSIIIVACLTSIITSDIVDQTVDLHNKVVGVVALSWEEFLGRLLVNRHRSNNNTVRFLNYDDLIHGLTVNTSIDAALMDWKIASVMQDQLQSHDLGES